MEETIGAGQRGRGCYFSPRQSAMNLGLRELSIHLPPSIFHFNVHHRRSYKEHSG